MARAVDGLASKPCHGEQGETEVKSTSGWFVSMRTFFRDELQVLPPHRNVDFTIELHPGTSPISMTPHRMVPA